MNIYFYHNPLFFDTGFLSHWLGYYKTFDYLLFFALFCVLALQFTVSLFFLIYEAKRKIYSFLVTYYFSSIESFIQNFNDLIKMTLPSSSSALLLDALVDQAQCVYRPLLMDFLIQKRQQKDQKNRWLSQLLYQRIGQYNRDQRKLNSLFSMRRMSGLRNLAHFEKDSLYQQEAITKNAPNREKFLWLINELSAQHINEERLYAFLNDLSLLRRLKEAPYYYLFESLSADQLQQLIFSMDKLRNPVVKKILLIVTARKIPQASHFLIDEAMQQYKHSPEKTSVEVLIGVARAMRILSFRRDEYIRLLCESSHVELAKVSFELLDLTENTDLRERLKQQESPR